MNIIFVDSTHQYLIDELIKKNINCHLEFTKSKKEVEKIIDKYDGIVIRSRFQLDKEFIDKASNLKFIARAGSGLENIDVNYANQKHIKCINAGEGNKQAVAEHALGMILNLTNKINTANNQLKKFNWFREENRGIELSGKTFGIIGYGNTGSAFSNLLKNFNVNILAFDKYKKSYQFKSTLEQIYNESDFISLHIPLTNETHNYIDKDFISKMKKPFYLINTSRGKCVNTQDLVVYLKSGKILGACLDVFEHEKNSFEELEKNENLDFLLQSKKTILTPHIAGWSNESYFKIAKVLSEKILKELI